MALCEQFPLLFFSFFFEMEVVAWVHGCDEIFKINLNLLGGHRFRTTVKSFTESIRSFVKAEGLGYI